MTKTDQPTIVSGKAQEPAGVGTGAPAGPVVAELRPGGDPEIVDVWSRTAPKYRRRAALFLSASALLFCGLCCFTYWIRTGVFWTPGLEDYGTLLWNSFDWRGQEQITLTDMLFYPISAQRVPMMLVIVGLTVGTLIAIPILVGILYRLPAALVFVCVIALLAVMPWLAINVLLSCFIATMRRIRLRYVSAMLGLLPLVLYFVLATTNPSEVLEQLAPAEQIKLYFPWILAMIWAALLMGAVLLLARVVNYRPGAIAPLLAVSFAIPVLLFESEVGRDELHYRLLELEYGPRSAKYFVNEEKPSVVESLAERQFRGSKDPKLSLEAIRSSIQRWWEFASEEIGRELAVQEEILARNQYRVSAACDRFLEDYSKSKYVPNVLYIKARALDMRVDAGEFFREGRLRYYQDFPSPRSREVWVTLLTRHPETTLSAVARLRLACFYAREGRVGQALELLAELEAFDTNGDGTRDKGAGLFGAEPPDASLAVSLPGILQEGRKLRRLFARNRDPQYDDAPLIRLMQLDPRHPRYERNLRDLKAQYGNSALRDNIDLRLALQIRSRTQRAARLSAIIKEDVEGDALERALFELGCLFEEDAQPQRALEMFSKLTTEHPDSPWCEDAARRTEMIERRGRARG
jgi:hypothetical protein